MAKTTAEALPLTFAVDPVRKVSGLLSVPPSARAVYVMAHGAGAGMAHPFLAKFSALLADRGIAVFRYQFPYMEAKSRRPDRPEVATATVRAAVAEAAKRLPQLPIFAGGKSFGGRMTSTAEAVRPLGVEGIAFLGFPLHPPGAPAITRAEHLADVRVPLLFLQGTNDEFAELDLLHQVVRSLRTTATLHLIDGANHSFHVPAKSGRKDADVMAELADVMTAWMAGLAR